MYLVQRLQSVMSNAARLICSSSRYDHVSPLLHQLHWLKAPQQIDVQLTVLHELAAAYHAGEHLTANSVNVYDHQSRRDEYGRTRLSTVGDRILSVAAARTVGTCRNGPLHHVASAPSL